jgi:phage-related tail protein
VLLRKVLENLIIEIMKAKYPTDPELYFDVSRGRNQDFSVVLDNLFKKKNDFGDDSKKAIERLHQKLKPFKNDANDKVHSLYHIVENPQEIDEWNLDSIMALITEIKY